MAQPNPTEAVAMAQQEMEYRVELFNKYVYDVDGTTTTRGYRYAWTLGVVHPVTHSHPQSPTVTHSHPPILTRRLAFNGIVLYRMVGSCYDKCMDKRYKDGDLSVGENTCLDRCASKYWATTSIVGQLLGASQGR
jgi:import inner membrane translocase subunit TIM10